MRDQAQRRNGDGIPGKLDILTAKATLPTDGSLPGGKLVWLQNPGTFQGPWPERVLMEGPDVFFRISDLDNGNHAENRPARPSIPDGLWPDRSIARVGHALARTGQTAAMRLSPRSSLPSA